MTGVEKYEIEIVTDEAEPTTVQVQNWIKLYGILLSSLPRADKAANSEVDMNEYLKQTDSESISHFYLGIKGKTRIVGIDELIALFQ